MNAIQLARSESLLRRSAIVLVVVFLSLSFASRLFAQEVGDGFVQLSPQAQQIADAVNQARAEAGLHPLQVHPLLNVAAQAHVDDMLANHTYGHWGTDGTLARDRVARTGYAENPWVSENWVSSANVDGAMRWWMNDYIHRVNILTPRWVEVGIGAGARGEAGEMIFVTVFSVGAHGAEPTVLTAASSPSPALPAVVHIPDGGISYTIRPGDSLSAIAQRYGLAWELLAAANGLDDVTLLQIGEILRLPGVTAAAAPGIGGPGTAIRTDGEPYSVLPGDTLFGVAASLGLSWQQLADYNGLGEYSVLQIGQLLWIPRASQPDPVATAETVPDNVAYVYAVRPGDTLIDIALAHNVDWQSLLAINGFSESTILRPGQVIRLR